MNIIRLLKSILRHPLNKDEKFNAMLRFLKWQIGSQMISGSIIFDWIDESKLIVRKGEKGLTFNIYAGLQEFQDMTFLLHFLRKKDLFIDIGANAGSYTVLASSVIGAKSIAFEPIPETYKRLVENVHINNIENIVQCYNIGLGNQNDTLYFTTELGPMNHVIFTDEYDESSIAVKVKRLDEISDCESPLLIKIDVEGFETSVLEGAFEILKSSTLRSVIIELNGNGDQFGFDESLIIERMNDFGFKPYSYDPFNRSLTISNGKNGQSGNTLFIRDISFVVKRIKESPKFKIQDFVL